MHPRPSFGLQGHTGDKSTHWAQWSLFFVGFFFPNPMAHTQILWPEVQGDPNLHVGKAFMILQVAKKILALLQQPESPFYSSWVQAVEGSGCGGGRTELRWWPRVIGWARRDGGERFTREESTIRADLASLPPLIQTDNLPSSVFLPLWPTMRVSNVS